MVPTELFPPSELPWKLETDVHTGRRRKVPVGDLSDCPLRKMMQWKCEPDADQVRCWPIERLFRSCKNITVEVTEVEKQMQK
ncbi:hypothetical protein BZA77DRAFT_324408 [Pyronema omphalodes]|nr:hypothetical protein BZA77DRAFT_324408 [Pyronema omphalodes]